MFQQDLSTPGIYTILDCIDAGQLTEATASDRERVSGDNNVPQLNQQEGKYIHSV